jgi:hypothetical protein
MSNENQEAVNNLLRLQGSAGKPRNGSENNFSNHSNYHRSSKPPSSNASFSNVSRRDLLSPNAATRATGMASASVSASPSVNAIAKEKMAARKRKITNNAAEETRKKMREEGKGGPPSSAEGSSRKTRKTRKTRQRKQRLRKTMRKRKSSRNA